MTDFVILGADTDAGKTTFALLWLALFHERYAYWKPLESGVSDSEQVRRLTPAVVFPPVQQFAEPVAPLLAARRTDRLICAAAEIAAARPRAGDRQLVIETFGSPFSPLNETDLQLKLVRELGLPSVLVSSSAVGAIGRSLQCLSALNSAGVEPVAIVLVGPPDEFAVEQITRHAGAPVISLERPAVWSVEGIRETAARQRSALAELNELLRRARSASDRSLFPPAAGAASSPLVARDRRAVWHPYTSLRDPDPPLPVIGAQDEFLHLADGRRVIDGISSWWTILHGHRHAPLVAAMREALTQIDHVHFAGVTHPWAVELAEFLLASAPWPGGRVFYSDNGSTAVEVALKMAYQFWQHRGEERPLFIGFEHGYHGDTFGAMAVGRDPVFFGRFEPLLFRAEIVPLDADRLDEALGRNRGRVAAVIVEPLVQGAGGMRMHAPEELRALFEAAQRHDVLFIADEVMTGGGRTGWRWAHQSAGIAPDLICAAKTLTGGMMPLAATLAAPHIAAAWETADRGRTFFHGHSFTAHPLACAVAAANLRSLPDRIEPKAQRMEAFWRESLEPLREHPAVGDVRIRGSIAAVELKAIGGYLADVGRIMRQRCLEAGVVLRPLGNVLYALPPLNTSEASLRQIIAAMKGAIG